MSQKPTNTPIQPTKSIGKQLVSNQKLIVQAFILQNNHQHGESYEKLQTALTNIVGMVEQLQKSNHFQVTTMPIMKQQRELISQEAYSEFWKNNELVINQNFQKNAYLALLMQELEEERRLDKRRWEPEEERQLIAMYESGQNYQQIVESFPDRSERQIRKKVYYLNRRKQHEG